MPVTVERAKHTDYDACLSLWNDCCTEQDILYKSLNKADFDRLFRGTEEGFVYDLIVARTEEGLVGFLGGNRNRDQDKAYLTSVAVGRRMRRKGIGSRLVALWEGMLVEEGFKKGEIIFFNPSALSWIVPGTAADDHPNAPGVDVASGAYLFLKNLGYRDRVYQNSFYLPLGNYRIPPDLEKIRDRLASRGITVEIFDPERHRGFPALFDDLGSEDWRRRVMENLQRPDRGDPVLVVVRNGEVKGFAGPVRPEESGRGYFAGIGVHSDLRGQGAGKFLFASLCMKEREEGARFMTFFTGETNPARHIYEAARFKIVRTWADMEKILVKG